MSQRKKASRRVRGETVSKALDAALASAIQEIGALIEASSDTAELRRASRVLRNLAYIATLTANARNNRISGSVSRAARCEQSIERLYAELPAEVKW